MGMRSTPDTGASPTVPNSTYSGPPGVKRITPIVSKSRAGRIASPTDREHLAEIQRRPQHLGDALQQADAMLLPPLPVELGDRLDERADQAAHGAHPLDVDRAVRVREATQRAQRADDAGPDTERHEDRRPERGRLQLVSICSEARIRYEVRGAQHGSVEHVDHGRVGDRKAHGAFAVGRVPVRLRQEDRWAVFGEDRDRAPVIGEVADAQPIVRDQRAQDGREIVQEGPRVEFHLERPPEGGEAGGEVRLYVGRARG